MEYNFGDVDLYVEMLQIELDLMHDGYLNSLENFPCEEDLGFYEWAESQA